jgi:hypothetical protein
MEPGRFPHVAKGDRLRIPAESWNGLMDLARAVRAGEPLPSAGQTFQYVPFRYGRPLHSFAANQSTDVTRYVWDFEGEEWVDSGETDEVHAPPHMGTNAIVAGKWIRYDWCADSQRWEVSGREC